MKKVIVTGATGFIGSALTKKLLSQGITVYGIDINTEKLSQLCEYRNFVPITAGFSLYEQLEQLIIERNFDCFVHTAWAGQLGGSDLYNYSLQNSNVEATCIACDKAAALDVKRFVFCSSSYMEMYTEETSFAVNYYGIAKKASVDFCKAICHKNHIECNIAVLTNTYGIGDRSNKAVNTFLRKLLANEDLDLIDGSKPNDWVYIDDTVAGIIAIALSAEPNKDYYVGHTEISTFKEKLIAMKRVLNSTSELRFGKYRDDTFVKYENLNIDQLNTDLGFECLTNFEESILKTSEWLKTLK